MLDMILAGLSEALQLANLLFVLLGVIAGMIAGAIPGVNGPMAIALCIPLSYYMSPVAAIGFLVGLNKGAFFGGSISGVLRNTPGTPESAATTWDGYPLAKQGKGEKALRMALYASVTGDAFATLVLILVAAPLAAVALYMGPVSYTHLRAGQRRGWSRARRRRRWTRRGRWWCRGSCR